MMGSASHARLHHKFDERQTRRHVQRNGQTVFSDDQVGIEIFHRGLELLSDDPLHFVNLAGDLARAQHSTEALFVDRGNGRMFEMKLRNQTRIAGQPFTLASDVDTLMPHRFQKCGPFLRFQAHAVESCQASGNECDSAAFVLRRLQFLISRQNCIENCDINNLGL